MIVRSPGSLAGRKKIWVWILLAFTVAFITGIICLILFVRHATFRILHWIEIHWLNAIAVTAAATVALVAVTILVPFVIRRLDQKSGEAVRPKTADRSVMLHRVRYNWIDGVLDQSLARAALLTLRLQSRTDLLELGTRTIRRPGRAPAPLMHSTSILRIFDDVGGGLLILGAPGAGKTTLLLQLANELLQRAENDSSQPIPVVLNLASWAVRREPLSTWLVTELWDSYKVPARTGQAWVAQDDLIVLLDGLDEVAEHHRAACVQAVNAYRRDHGLAGLVVCSRSQELHELAIRLDLEQAVELRPPTQEQIDTYLSHLESTGTPLADIRADLATDRSLRELLGSPLMLHIIALAYHGRPAFALHDQGSVEQRRKWLWQAYVDRMFEQRPLDSRCGYGDPQAVRWLGWLAAEMRKRGQTEFHLDRLDPSWLNIRVYGWNWVVRNASIIWSPAEDLHWSWKTFFRRVNPLGGLIRMMWWLVLPVAGMTPGLRDLRNTPNEGIRRSGKNALICGLAVFSFWIFFALLAGLLNSDNLSPKVGSEPILLRYLVHGLIQGFACGLLCVIVFGGSAWISHYAVRGLLRRTGAIPPRYGLFLEEMTKRLLLRSSGSAYIFVHRLLRDYMADNATRDISKDATTANSNGMI